MFLENKSPEFINNIVNSKQNKNGPTALCYVIKKDNFEVLDFLLKNGANPNEKAPCYLSEDKKHSMRITPLIHAARVFLHSDEKVYKYCKKLLEYNAAIDNDDRTILLLSNMAVHNNTKSMELLFKYNVDVNQTDDKKMTPLQVACTVSNNNEDAIRLLLEHNANPNQVIPPSNIIAALDIAYKKNRSANIIRLLLKHGATGETLNFYYNGLPCNLKKDKDSISHLLKEYPDYTSITLSKTGIHMTVDWKRYFWRLIEDGNTERVNDFLCHIEKFFPETLNVLKEKNDQGLYPLDKALELLNNEMVETLFIHGINYI